MVFHLEHVIQPSKNFFRIVKIGFGKGALAQHIEDRDRQHGRAHAMAGDIDQIADEVIFVERTEAERIAADLGRRNDKPFRLAISGRNRRRQQRENVIPSLFKVAIQILRFFDLARTAPLKFENLPAHFQGATVGQQRCFRNPLAIDIGAVGRTKIGRKNFAGHEFDPAVPARDVRTG
jgi:hypothetical protein